MGFIPIGFNQIINGKIIKFKSHPLLFNDGKKTYVIEDNNEWLSKRNRLIAMRRALIILGVIVLVWGLVIWVAN